MCYNLMLSYWLDWLARHYASLDCREKVVIFRIPNEDEFHFRGDKAQGGKYDNLLKFHHVVSILSYQWTRPISLMFLGRVSFICSLYPPTPFIQVCPTLFLWRPEPVFRASIQDLILSHWSSQLLCLGHYWKFSSSSSSQDNVFWRCSLNPYSCDFH